VSSEKLLNILLEGNDIEQRSAWLDIDEEIDVAALVIVTARHRAEHSHVTHPVTRRGIQDVAAVLTERF
jgi:hypothetical protein